MLTQVPINQKLAKRRKFSLLVFLLVLSCNSKPNNNINNIKETDKAVSGTYVWSKEKIDSLIYRAIQKNDHIAYTQVASYLSLSFNRDKYFTVAFLMANKNNNPLAFYNLYRVIIYNKVYPNSIQFSDEKSKLFALYCLLRANELGYKCDNDLEEYFDQKKIPKSEIYLKKYHDFK